MPLEESLDAETRREPVEFSISITILHIADHLASTTPDAAKPKEQDK